MAKATDPIERARLQRVVEVLSKDLASMAQYRVTLEAQIPERGAAAQADLGVLDDEMRGNYHELRNAQGLLDGTWITLEEFMQTPEARAIMSEHAAN